MKKFKFVTKWTYALRQNTSPQILLTLTKTKIMWCDNHTCVQRLCMCVGTYSALTKFRKANNLTYVSVCLSVRLDVISRLAQDDFSWNLIFDFFRHTSRNSSVIKIRQELGILYMNSCVCPFVVAGWVLVRNGIVSGQNLWRISKPRFKFYA